MANALITFTQGASTGGAGYALMGSTGPPVTVSNGDDSGVENWKFEILDVGYGSSVSQGVVQDGNTPTFSFIPDQPGGYVVRLTTTDSEGNIYTDVRVFGVPEGIGSSFFIPPFLGDAGSMNFKISEGVYNTKGWGPYMATWLKEIGDSISLSAILRYTAPGVIPITGLSQSVALDYTGGGFIQPMPVGAPDGFVVSFDDLSAAGEYTWPSTEAGLSVTGSTKIQNPQSLALVTGDLLWSVIGALPGSGYQFRRFATENVWKIA